MGEILSIFLTQACILFHELSKNKCHPSKENRLTKYRSRQWRSVLKCVTHYMTHWLDDESIHQCDFSICTWRDEDDVVEHSCDGINIFVIRIVLSVAIVILLFVHGTLGHRSLSWRKRVAKDSHVLSFIRNRFVLEKSHLFASSLRCTRQVVNRILRE